MQLTTSTHLTCAHACACAQCGANVPTVIISSSQQQSDSHTRLQSPTLLPLLSAAAPTQVIPRVNPLYAPTASYVSDDRSRLLLRLDMYGLQERQVQGDGNCQVCVCVCVRQQREF